VNPKESKRRFFFASATILNIESMDSQFNYKDTQIDLTIGQALLELGGAWITENEQGQRFLTPQANLLTSIEQVLNKYKENSPDEEPDFEFEFTAMRIPTVNSSRSADLKLQILWLNIMQCIILTDRNMSRTGLSV
jgi:hypothetical protein